jgi:hypothetical protein
MDSEKLISALNGVIQRLVLLAAEDAELRSELRRLAESVLEMNCIPEQQAAPESVVEEPPAVEVAGELVSPTVAEETITEATTLQEAEPFVPLAEVLQKLTLGQAKPAVETAPVSYPAHWFKTTTADLLLIEARCRLKAEGARWAATRRRLIMDHASFSTEIDPRDRAIISKAKAVPDCFLWMCHPSGPSPSDPKRFEDVAGCFDAVADILSIVKQIQDDPELHRAEFERSLDLLAEAQCALRASIDIIHGPTDTDQTQVFNWLKATASEMQVFIQRYMRIDDPVDPRQFANLESRIEALDTKVQENRERNKQRKKLLGKVRHKTSLIASDQEVALEQWRSLIPIVEELVSDGLPPSNPELRALLVPVIDSLPDDLDVPAGLGLVLREIDRFMAAYPPPEAKPVGPPTQEVQEVAKLLKDKSLVMIGGDRRGGAYQAIKDAFDLKELIWIETREHQSIAGFENHVARPDVAAVLLAIRWASHSYGEVKDFCDQYGKPLVRLPGGYGLNQVAAQIMTQCSGRLSSP